MTGPPTSGPPAKLSADLQSGTVEVGDAVYSQHIAKPAEMLTTPELPQPENQALLENVQKNN